MIVSLFISSCTMARSPSTHIPYSRLDFVAHSSTRSVWGMHFLQPPGSSQSDTLALFKRNKPFLVSCAVQDFRLQNPNLGKLSHLCRSQLRKLSPFVLSWQHMVPAPRLLHSFWRYLINHFSEKQSRKFLILKRDTCSSINSTNARWISASNCLIQRLWSIPKLAGQSFLFSPNHQP